MVLKINRNHPSAWRTVDDLQLSTGSSRVVLENISVPEQNLLALLYRGVADAQFDALAEATAIDSRAAYDLLERVGSLLEKPAPRASSSKAPALDAAFADSAFSEIVRAGLDHQTNGAEVLRQRQSRVVHIDSLGKTGLTLVRGLAAAGIGKLVSHDNRVVNASDLGVDGFESNQLGTSRFLATNQLLERAPKQGRLANGNRMSANSINRLDAALIIAQQVIDPRRYASWQNRNVPHLAITFSVTEVLISPVVIPGSSPCLMCFELNRAQADESWPALAPQLAKSALRFDDVASRWFASGLAIRQLLSVLDRSIVEPGLPAFDRGYRLDLVDQRISELNWPRLPSCQCSSAANAKTLTVLDL